MDVLVNKVLEEMSDASAEQIRMNKLEKSQARLKVINKTIEKLYLDNAEGKLSDSRLESMVGSLEKEAFSLEAALESLSVPTVGDEIRSNYEKFFALAKQYSCIETLDRDTLLTFIERIVVGPKVLPEGYVKAPRKNASYQQNVTIYYKFIGTLPNIRPVQNFPPQLDSAENAAKNGGFTM